METIGDYFGATPTMILTGASVGLFSIFFSYQLLISAYPSILHKRKSRLGPLREKAQIIGHRGSRSEACCENTMASFLNAVEVGAHVVELDCWLTADKQIVVHHDETLSRMTAGECNDRISDLTYDQLPLVYSENDHRRHRIPLLSEVFDALPKDICVIVEIKQDSDLLISAIKDLIYAKNRQLSVFWFSLVESANRKLRLADPELPTICSVKGMLKTLFLYYIGLLPFFSLDDAVFGITLETITIDTVRKEKALAGAPHIVHHALAFFFRGSPARVLLVPGLFRHLRLRGVPVFFLGVNTEREARLAADAGATAVLTDKVAWLAGYMRDNAIVLKPLFS